MLPIDVIRACDKKAADYGLPAAHVAAVVHVESNGVVFAQVGGRALPVVAFEPHLFYRRLSGAVRAEAVALKLASAKWNRKLYAASQGGRWAQINAAKELMGRHGLDKNIPLECASYGVGQVLGSHWKALGFAGIMEFMETMLSGAEGQIDIMLRYVFANHLDDELIEGRWAPFARGYNGKEFAKNQYDTKLIAAAALYGGKSAGADGMLRIGSRGLRVRELQTLLQRAGYGLKVDGDFGTSTRDTLRAFQGAYGITVDGVYGPETESVLAQFRQSPEEKPGVQATTDVAGVREGAGGVAAGIGIEAAKGAIDDATLQLQHIEIVSPYIEYALSALSVAAAILAIAGVAWALKSWLDTRKTVEV